MSRSEKITIFDTTLRDGFRLDSLKVSREQRVAIAEGLAGAGVSVIEVGFNCQTDQELKDSQEIARHCGEAIVCALGSNKPADLERAKATIAPARRGRIHTFTPVSDRMIQRFGVKTREATVKAIEKGVSYARNIHDEVQWAAFDATSADIDFVCRCVEIAIKAGANTISLPDTPGKATPFEYVTLFETVRAKVPGVDKVVLGTHCHNDRGMATANTICAVEKGAEQVEGTIIGIGERAGNAPLEEVAAALGERTLIDIAAIREVAALVSQVTGFPITAHKPIVGTNAVGVPTAEDVRRVAS